MNPIGKVVRLFGPVSMTDSATQSANVDMRGWDHAIVTVGLSDPNGTGTNTNGATISILHDDTTVVTNFATVTANRTVGGTIANVNVYAIDWKGKERYLRVTCSTGTNGTHDNQVVYGEALLLKGEEMPGSTSEMLGTTNDFAIVVT